MCASRTVAVCIDARSMDVGLEDARLKKTESDLEKVCHAWIHVCVCVLGGCAKPTSMHAPCSPPDAFAEGSGLG